VVTRAELTSELAHVNERITNLAGRMEAVASRVDSQGWRLAWILGGIALVGFEIPIAVVLIAAGVIRVH